MTPEPNWELEPRMRAAIAELREMIAHHYPGTTFVVGTAEDPAGVYLRAVVDADDMDAVADRFMDRLVDLQVEEGLPIYVVPVRTSTRMAALLRARQAPAPPVLSVAVRD